VRFQPLLQLHLIRDPLHAAASARYSYRAVDILARAHEAARLNNTLKCLDFDLGDLQAALIGDRCLDLGRDDVIDVLAGPLMRARGRTA